MYFWILVDEVFLGSVGFDFFFVGFDLLNLKRKQKHLKIKVLDL